MKVRVTLDLELDDNMPLRELGEGLPAYLERREDVITAYVVRARVEPKPPTQAKKPPRPPTVPDTAEFRHG